VLTARFGPRGKTALARFLQENSIQTVAFDEVHASAALDVLVSLDPDEPSAAPEQPDELGH
jgi:hypothetical protein